MGVAARGGREASGGYQVVGTKASGVGQGAGRFMHCIHAAIAFHAPEHLHHLLPLGRQLEHLLPQRLRLCTRSFQLCCVLGSGRGGWRRWGGAPLPPRCRGSRGRPCSAAQHVLAQQRGRGAGCDGAAIPVGVKAAGGVSALWSAQRLRRSRGHSPCLATAAPPPPHTHTHPLRLTLPSPADAPPHPAPPARAAAQPARAAAQWWRPPRRALALGAAAAQWRGCAPPVPGAALPHPQQTQTWQRLRWRGWRPPQQRVARRLAWPAPRRGPAAVPRGFGAALPLQRAAEGARGGFDVQIQCARRWLASPCMQVKGRCIARSPWCSRSASCMPADAGVAIPADAGEQPVLTPPEVEARGGRRLTDGGVWCAGVPANSGLLLKLLSAPLWGVKRGAGGQRVQCVRACSTHTRGTAHAPHRRRVREAGQGGKARGSGRRVGCRQRVAAHGG